MYASTFELFVDANGKYVFPIYLGDKPTGETVSYLSAHVGGTIYRYGFNPEKETIQEVIPKLQEHIKKETGER